MSRLDADHQAAVRLCLVVIMLPIAVGVAAFDRVLRQDLARAREDLAGAVAAQDPDRHFKGLRESPEVIAAYDAVRAAEAAVAKLEKENLP